MSYDTPPMLLITATDRGGGGGGNRNANDRRISPSDPAFTPRQPTERTHAPESGPDATGTRTTPMQSYVRWALLLGLPLALSLLNDRDDS